jgi:hypothetical protein
MDYTDTNQEAVDTVMEAIPHLFRHDLEQMLFRAIQYMSKDQLEYLIEPTGLSLEQMDDLVHGRLDIA